MRSLIETDTATKVPCEVLGRLPHPDPFIVFPTPLPAPVAISTPLPVGQIAEQPVIVGMLVTGLTSDQQLCSTADPRVRSLYVALAARIRYEGQDPTYEESVLTFPLSGHHSVDDLLEDAKHYDKFGVATPEDERDMYCLALSLLLYMCSDRRSRDVVEQQPDRREARKRGTSRARAKVIDMGFDIGPKLMAEHRRASESRNANGTGLPTGVTRQPHIRRAHWHTFLTGSRRDPQRDLRWLPPLFIHAEQQRRPRVVEVDATST